MIARLTGKILSKKPPFLVIDVQGVGYELQAPMSTFYKLEAQEQSLYVHMLIRENSQNLYGFFTEAEKHCFIEIIKVSGVGPKLALSVLSSMSLEHLAECIKQRDLARIVKIPGVGKKTAERILIELQDKLDKYINPNSNFSSNNHAKLEAMEALIALGYKENEAKTSLAKIEESLDSQTMIKLALQSMVK